MVQVPVSAIDSKLIQPTSNCKYMDEGLTTLLRVGLAANFLLFFGGCMSIGFYAREFFVAWWTRDPAGDVLYLLGFAALFLSGLLELGIDVGLSRSFGHGRYSTKKPFNLVITLLYLVGNLGDLIAFLFWRNGKEGIQEEHLTQWVSSHIFLLTSILVLLTNRPKFDLFQNQLDSVANIVFFGESLLACCARYTSTVGDTKQNHTEMSLELASAVLWMSSAFCYLFADIVRFKNPDSIILS